MEFFTLILTLSLWKIFAASSAVIYRVLGSEYCSGYSDLYGKWNTGFYCPQTTGSTSAVFCCGTSYFKYCCTTKPPLVDEDHDDHDAASISPYTVRVPIFFAIFCGVLAVVILLVTAICFFCSCCVVYKKRRDAAASAGMYRFQGSSSTASALASIYSNQTGNSLVTTPLDSDWPPSSYIPYIPYQNNNGSSTPLPSISLSSSSAYPSSLGLGSLGQRQSQNCQNQQTLHQQTVNLGNGSSSTRTNSNASLNNNNNNILPTFYYNNLNNNNNQQQFSSLSNLHQQHYHHHHHQNGRPLSALSSLSSTASNTSTAMSFPLRLQQNSTNTTNGNVNTPYSSSIGGRSPGGYANYNLRHFTSQGPNPIGQGQIEGNGGVLNSFRATESSYATFSGNNPLLQQQQQQQNRFANQNNNLNRTLQQQQFPPQRGSGGLPLPCYNNISTVSASASSTGGGGRPRTRDNHLNQQQQERLATVQSLINAYRASSTTSTTGTAARPASLSTTDVNRLNAINLLVSAVLNQSQRRTTMGTDENGRLASTRNGCSNNSNSNGNAPTDCMDTVKSSNTTTTTSLIMSSGECSTQNQKHNDAISLQQTTPPSCDSTSANEIEIREKGISESNQRVLLVKSKNKNPVQVQMEEDATTLAAEEIVVALDVDLADGNDDEDDGDGNEKKKKFGIIETSVPLTAVANDQDDCESKLNAKCDDDDNDDSKKEKSDIHYFVGEISKEKVPLPRETEGGELSKAIINASDNDMFPTTTNSPPDDIFNDCEQDLKTSVMNQNEKGDFVLSQTNANSSPADADSDHSQSEMEILEIGCKMTTKEKLLQFKDRNHRSLESNDHHQGEILTVVKD